MLNIIISATVSKCTVSRTVLKRSSADAQWHGNAPQVQKIALENACNREMTFKHLIPDNHAKIPPLSFFYRPDALPAAQPTVSKH